MMVTFQSRFGRIAMFGDVAVQTIRMLGRTGSVPGALLAEEIPEALANLQAAIDAHERFHPEKPVDDENDNPVSLRRRALPLIELLRHAAREGSEVMWEQAGAGPLQF